MIGRLTHVMLWTQRLDASVAWYEAKLGFTADYVAPGEFASLSHPKMGRLSLHETAKGSPDVGHGPMPYYAVDDIEATRAWLLAAGVRVHEIRQVGDSPRHTWLWDVDGNALGLEQH